MTDTPLLIIKEKINCGNFLDKDKFNFLTRRVNDKSLTDFPIIVVDKRLYGEALFHIFPQNEIPSNTYKTDRIMIDFVKFFNSNHSDINKLYYNYSCTTTQRKHKGVEKEVCSIIYVLNFKNYFPTNHFKGIPQKDIGKRALKMNLKEALQRNIYFQNIISGHNDIASNSFTKANCKLI